MGDWLNKNLSCFECGSSDAMQESEHHFKCFSCNKTFLKKNYSQTNNIRYSMNYKTNLIDKGEYYDLKTRGNITKKTCQKYGITCSRYTGTFGHGENQHYLNNEPIYIFNYYKNNEIIKQKLRPVNKKNYKILGDSSFKEFFGQNIFKIDSNRILVITEGEFEAAVIYQEAGFNAVSLPNGISSLISCIKNNFDYIFGWKYIIIAVDNDEPSQKEVNKFLLSDLVNKLGPGKIRIVKWPLKDANELLIQNRSPDIKKALWDAEEYRPKDLFKASDLIESALIKPDPGINTPWPSLTRAISGWRSNTIITIAGADGIGKSELKDEIIFNLIKNGHSTWVWSVEEEGEELIRRQAGKYLDLPLHIPDIKWDIDKIKNAMMKIGDNLIIWKPETVMTTDDLLNRMQYVSVANNVKYFIIDHLKGIDSQMTDINNSMAKFLSDLKLFCKTYKTTVILLSHVAKDKKQGRVGKDDESWNRGRIPTKENIYGSSAIAAWSDIIIVLSRNVESDNSDIACVTLLSILKNRLMGNRGQKKIFTKYIEDTGRIIEIEPIDYSGSIE